MKLVFDIDIEAQPTEVTCGPTCLNSLYHHLGLNTPLKEVVQAIPQLEDGGTLGVHLGIDAIQRGFDVTVYSHNLTVFDPSWFALEKKQFIHKLEQQLETEKHEKTRNASKVYIQFLKAGGTIAWEELTGEFIYQTLKKAGPVIIGLSATYLYWSQREYGENCDYDDVRGEPQGHFVLVYGIDLEKQLVDVADPHRNNPYVKNQKYQVSLQRFINSTLLGALTYDSNIIKISKKEKPTRKIQRESRP